MRRKESQLRPLAKAIAVLSTHFHMLCAGSLTTAMCPAQRLLVSRRRAELALGQSRSQHLCRPFRSSPVFAQQRQSDGEESDKSWSEIARGAASVAGCALVGTLDLAFPNLRLPSAR